ncbi:metal-dependent hydrolase [Helicobacter pylori]|uniref:Adenosine deaminase n=1 Tax=Helicobacter pylori TaxID=210 RepID=A0AAE7PI88_HELPX|nr:aminofutalosine deaminase [Helicobacter pylori]AFI00548.1 chlorohydrolase [Helicobacter pylori Shi112]QQW93265.1 metal-dependent hydrolase [Helicobacter pylori]QQX50634.1 adenosine deaminase [Helicobacter pylori]
MQEIIGASLVFLCNEKCEVLEDYGVVFDEKIVEIGDYKSLTLKYPHLKAQFFENSVLLPAFINAHTHFEFSNNKASFDYGSFSGWLGSVLNNGGAILENCQGAIQNAISAQLKSGVGSVGAISNHLIEVNLLKKSPLNAVVFLEFLGSSYSLEKLKAFEAKFKELKDLEDKKLKAALAVHAPYSVQKDMALSVIQLAKDSQSLLSTHFLESFEELEWVENSKGWFENFYQHFLKESHFKSLYKGANDYIDMFEDTHTLFVHNQFASLEMLKRIKSQVKNAFLITCPFSNRLLSGQALDLERTKEAGLSVSVATDGLSSNISLSLLDELRAFLLTHNMPLLKLAKIALLGATRHGAKALALNNGEIEANKMADLSVFNFGEKFVKEQAVLQFLLHAKEVERLFLGGKRVI